jgi:hypothetical protein
VNKRVALTAAANTAANENLLVPNNEFVYPDGVVSSSNTSTISPLTGGRHSGRKKAPHDYVARSTFGGRVAVASSDDLATEMGSTDT